MVKLRTRSKDVVKNDIKELGECSETSDWRRLKSPKNFNKNMIYNKYKLYILDLLNVSFILYSWRSM